jgi:hypothetical protein
MWGSPLPLQPNKPLLLPTVRPVSLRSSGRPAAERQSLAGGALSRASRQGQGAPGEPLRPGVLFRPENLPRRAARGRGKNCVWEMFFACRGAGLGQGRSPMGEAQRLSRHDSRRG